jgi:c-di-GMP-binding flagellar brake protein YcgR
MAFSLKQFIPFLNLETEQVSDGDIRHNQKINGIFQLLKENRTPLRITLPDSNKAFSSNILAVDLANRLFTLDEIYPVDGHKLFESTGMLIAEAELRGAKITFEARLVSSDNSRPIASYNCQIPESVSYIQRRGEYRVSVPPSHMLQITAEHRKTRQLLQGNLTDLSTQGIGVNFNTAHTIKPGDQLTNCHLLLPTNETVDFAIEVRHIESTALDTIRVGGTMLELDNRSGELINRLVRQLERANIKR